MVHPIEVRRELCFVEVIEGETDRLERQLGEFGFVDRLKALDVRARSIEINAAGCFVVIDSDDTARLRIAARPFNLAVRMHECCGSIVLHPESTGPLPALGDVIAAFHRSGLAIVHLSATLSELTLFVEDDDVDAAMLLVERLTQTLASVAA